jgi:hypothetical protein
LHEEVKASAEAATQVKPSISHAELAPPPLATHDSPPHRAPRPSPACAVDPLFKKKKKNSRWIGG